MSLVKGEKKRNVRRKTRKKIMVIGEKGGVRNETIMKKKEKKRSRTWWC